MSTIHSSRYLVEKMMLNHYGDDFNRISKTIYNSKINLNPHQINAALFAFKSPTSKGVMLCDEVGLGKTIEAGIVIAQYWYERKRKILIITPSSLMNQWSDELEQKFNLDTVIINAKSIQEGEFLGNNPFDKKNKIMITSYYYASKYNTMIKSVNLDLVIIDEAHKLRNILNNSIVAQNIALGISDTKKILLTATPLQNNLLELFGLMSIIDNGIFGDKEMFQEVYIKNFDDNKYELKERISNYLYRTLRSDVAYYIKYPKRITQTFKFEPSQEEQRVYELITELIKSNPTFGTGKAQTIFTSIILRKLLSSSTVAVIGTLKSIESRLISYIKNGYFEDEIFENEEFFDEDYDLFEEEANNDFTLKDVEEELLKIKEIIALAEKIDIDQKTYKLLEAIKSIFSNINIDNRSKKILIFTESRRTQDYLYKFILENTDYKTIIYNGENSSTNTVEIYKKWLEKNPYKSSNNRQTDIKTALIEYFKEEAEIMIATEAGAEGLNLQFCSVVINYDMPWNPQRVEQRIGRVHRYGQNHDVIVVNFLNESNVIDLRVYELLSNKFHLFDEVFGSSDEVLGRFDNAFNFERKIFEIYKNSRTPEEINESFKELQSIYEDDINVELEKTEELLLQNFDQDLFNNFEAIKGIAKDSITELENDFLRICKTALSSFTEKKKGIIEVIGEKEPIPKGKYTVLKNLNSEDLIQLRPNNDFGNKIIEKIINTPLNMDKEVVFNLTDYNYKLSDIEQIKNKKATIQLTKVEIDSLEKEEHLILQGITSDGEVLDQTICEKLFRLTSSYGDNRNYDGFILEKLSKNIETAVESVTNYSIERNNIYVSEEINKINSWADDRIFGIQLKVEKLREKRKEIQKQADYSTNYDHKVKLIEEIQKISKQIKKLWLELAENEEIIEDIRKNKIDDIKKTKIKRIDVKNIFTINVRVI